MITTTGSGRAGRTRALPRWPVLVVAVLLVLVAVVLLLDPGDSFATLVVDDLAQLAAAGFAAVTTGWCARRTSDRRRLAWGALAVGCAAWAAGQAVWSWYELVEGRETPFPSVADLGFLGFAACAIGALLLYPVADGRGDGSRRVLDGVAVTAAVGLISWSTALGAALQEEGQTVLAAIVGTAYPATDVVALVLVVLLVGRRVPDRVALSLLGCGISAIALSDSLFLWLTASGSYSSESHAVSLGWCVGFALLGLAPLAVDTATVVREETRDVPAAATALPYVPLSVAAGTVGVQLLIGSTVDRVEVLLAGLALTTVLVRQYATVRDNGRLLAELAEREAELRHLAFHDGLTGLANRALFRDRVGHALELHRRDRRPLAVLFCDLDDFKVINDTTGHAGGDELLVRVAERLRGALRAGDTLARLGGDEFAVLLEDSRDARGVAQKLVDALQAPFTLQGVPTSVQVSVGVTSVLAEAATPTADDLLAQADTAMYAAKRGGKNALRAFEPGMALAEVADSELARALEQAVRDGDVTLAYQPIVDLPSGRVASVEALARWTRDGQVVPPSVFIAVAERTGLVEPLTAALLDVVCRQAALWSSQTGRRDLRVGLNLSPSTVVDPGLPRLVAAALARHGLTGEALTLEVTESALLSDPPVARVVCSALRAMGVHLSLDDFGVGYSSLAHLHALPLDSLKVDRAFVDLVDLDEDQRRFTRAVLRLGEDLGLEVVAEGVERPEQLAALQEMGCRLVQGYLLSRPVPAGQLTALLDRPSLLPVAVPAPR